MCATQSSAKRLHETLRVLALRSLPSPKIEERREAGRRRGICGFAASGVLSFVDQRLAD
jgi:hypothetical protein